MGSASTTGVVVLLCVVGAAGCAGSSSPAPVAVPAACDLAKAPHETASELAALVQRLETARVSPPPVDSPRAGRRFEAVGQVMFAVSGLRGAADRERQRRQRPDAPAQEPTVDQAQEELARACQALRTS